jgi:hypothetical protein
MQQRIRFIVFAFLAVFIACAVCFKFVFTEKPFEAIEKCQWNSIEVSYCLGDGPDVTKKSQIILDKEVLSKLKASFCGHSWAYAELHVLSKWNKIAISLDDGNKEMLVLYPNKACYVTTPAIKKQLLLIWDQISRIILLRFCVSMKVMKLFIYFMTLTEMSKIKKKC